MDKGIEKIHQMPHNQLRKAMCIKQCIRNLEGLQRRYTPTFDEDLFINTTLEQFRAELARVMEPLQDENDVDGLMRAAFDET